MKVQAKFKNWPYIEFDEKGRPIIAGTRIKVSFLVQEKKAFGWSPEEIYFQHPELSLAQIHSALSYYYAHQEEVDREIEEETKAIEALKAKLKEEGIGLEAKALKEKLEGKAA